MRSIESLSRAAASLMFCAALAAPPSVAARQPRFGGTLRVELHALTVSLDPREWRAGSEDAATGEKLAALLFDRLVSLDNYGRIQPELATEWSHDASFKRWQFTLRGGVKFSDGAPLKTADVVTALQPLFADARQVTASGNFVVIQSATAIPDLLEELASGGFFICSARAGGGLIGTGPFVLEETSGSASRLLFREREDAWAGRPFVDAIEITLGVPPLRQLYDLQLGRAELVVLSPDLVRRAAQGGLRTWISAPVTLYLLRFNDAQPAARDTRLREGVSLSQDRATMAGVLLQRQAEPAAALLPQWLSGYAFLFNVETNQDRAREIRAALPAGIASAAEPLRLRVDAPGDTAKLLGERVAVNARQAGIVVQVVQRGSTRSAAAAADPPLALRLVSWRITAISPRVELDALSMGLGLNEGSDAAPSRSDSEELHAREKQILDSRRVLPLVVLPEVVGLGANVRNWMPARWGDWHLAGVWLDAPENNAPAKPTGAHP